MFIARFIVDVKYALRESLIVMFNVMVLMCFDGELSEDSRMM